MISKTNGHDYEQTVALSTWHGGDNLRNISQQLLNETAEISKLYHKAEFKPGYDLDPAMLIDELGDAYYYLLVGSASYGVTIDKIKASHPYGITGFDRHVTDIAAKHNAKYCLAQMARSAANIWSIVENVIATGGTGTTWGDVYPLEDWRRWLLHYYALLNIAGMPLAEVVAWNQRKLAGGNNHGWKPALPSIGDVAVLCNVCDWAGTVAQAEPDVDGDGGLGCPQCGVLIEVSSSGVNPS